MTRTKVLSRVHCLSLTAWILILGACSSYPPSNLGTQEGQLSACPEKPNCVSSQTALTDPHYIPPLAIDSKADWERLADMLEAMENITVTNRQDNYLHAEAMSRLFRFVDDLEFLLQESEHQIQVRSASRVGYSDLGVNRERIEQLRNRLATP